MYKIQVPPIRLPRLEKVKIPPLCRIQIKQPCPPGVEDIELRVRAELEASIRLNALASGARVAVAVGSRGIASLGQVVQSAVAWLKERGLVPFIVPAMGSHGGGTAQGQQALLHEIGISEETVGTPVLSSMSVTRIGKTIHGIDCMFDAHAAGADALLVINRVKSHTSFDRAHESGLIKMLAVGLGKAEGASNVHKLGARGLAEVLPALAEIALRELPIIYGLALVESERKELIHIQGVEHDAFFSTEEELLRLAKSRLPRLPFAQLDVLIVDIMGKNISGAGMDYAVTGRTDIRFVPNPDHIRVTKLGALRLSPESHGNAMGIGLADFTTLALMRETDLQALYVNAFTSTFVEKGKLPLILPTEEDVFRACLATCWQINTAGARLCCIRSTLDLSEMLIAPPLLKELKRQENMADHSEVERISKFFPTVFSEKGELLVRP
ncbi:MAG: hypothetical protein FWH34_02415 [Desulfovibrionaceae bacterium]|nr:hypothetical protein [Desulfovibrionaceae bacterium]